MVNKSQTKETSKCNYCTKCNLPILTWSYAIEHTKEKHFIDINVDIADLRQVTQWMIQMYPKREI